MKVLIIPSSILIPGEMRQKFGEIPTALFPLNDVTMLEHLYKKYDGLVDRIIVVGFLQYKLLEDYIHWKKLPIELVVARKLDDLGYSIFEGLKAIDNISDVDELYINFADTLLGDELAGHGRDVVFYHEKEPSNEWSFFEESNGEITYISDKTRNAWLASGKNRNAFVGAFMFSKPSVLFERLRCNVESPKNITDSFYISLAEYTKEQSMLFCNADMWFDVGHNENYYKAKTGVEARSFNSIAIDESRGILKKRSKNVEKFVGEINWYIKLPNRLQYLAPRVYDYSLEPEAPFVEMEYYGYHTLHELLMYSELPLVRWQEIFRRLRLIVDDMSRYSVLADEVEVLESLEDIYIRKTINRVFSLESNENFRIFFDTPIVVNGVHGKTLREYMDIFSETAYALLIKNYNQPFTIIHGDLCFANILIEESHKFMRLIDPRGKFGKYDIYGDQRYELAKIFHSLEGNYDYIIEDMFIVDRKGSKINLDIPKKSGEIMDVFLDVFKETIHDENAIRLIEASLFLSMIPLHSDHLERQYAMLATGIQLLEKVLEKRDNNV